jgi:hypothetical protein
MVAMTAEATIVKKSRNIQNFTFPWELRRGFVEASSTQSGGGATEAVTLSQKSDVAICVPQVSEFKASLGKLRRFLGTPIKEQ